ncbi:MAG: helix-turn-helix domain-containing protein [Candidatus Merdivicinus sp.]
MTISEKIREARSKAGLTQQQLADKLGVSQQYIANYESGKHYPKIQTLQKIADALEVSMADLLGLYSAAADCEASDLERLIELLFEFVERVVKKGATPEEVKILPETARLLAELMEEGGRK